MRRFSPPGGNPLQKRAIVLVCARPPPLNIPTASEATPVLPHPTPTTPISQEAGIWYWLISAPTLHKGSKQIPRLSSCRLIVRLSLALLYWMHSFVTPDTTPAAEATPHGQTSLPSNPSVTPFRSLLITFPSAQASRKSLTRTYCTNEPAFHSIGSAPARSQANSAT